MTHEEQVQAFYSCGSKVRGFQDGGFLSLGYWTHATPDYRQAAEDLLSRLLETEPPLDRGVILDVACGYGSETFRIYERLRPEKIIGIDLTEAHIRFAQNRASAQGLPERVTFDKMDAVRIPFESNSFSYIIGVEGPSHFRTREMFLRKAHDLLEPRGVLLLADIAVDRRIVGKNWFYRLMGHLCARHWHMPRENWISLEEYSRKLQEIGFSSVTVRQCGEHVFPGFARYNLKGSSILNALRIRGLVSGLGLTFISWMIGFLYKRGMLDYAFIRAAKDVPTP